MAIGLCCLCLLLLSFLQVTIVHCHGYELNAVSQQRCAKIKAVVGQAGFVGKYCGVAALVRSPFAVPAFSDWAFALFCTL